MPPCLTLSIISYGSKVKWSNPEKGVAPFPTPRYCNYRKGGLRVTLDYGRQLFTVPHQAGVHLGAMAMTEYSVFDQGSGITGASPLDCFVSYIQDIHREDMHLTPLQRSSWCILGCWRYSLLWFHCLMVYQPSFVIKCQSCPCNRTKVMIHSYILELGSKAVHTFHWSFSSKGT